MLELGEVVFQSFQSYHHDSDIVQSLLVESQFHDVFYCQATELVNVPIPVLVPGKSLPDDLDDFTVVQLVEDSIA